MGILGCREKTDPTQSIAENRRDKAGKKRTHLQSWSVDNKPHQPYTLLLLALSSSESSAGTIEASSELGHQKMNRTLTQSSDGRALLLLGTLPVGILVGIGVSFERGVIHSAKRKRPHVPFCCDWLLARKETLTTSNQTKLSTCLSRFHQTDEREENKFREAVGGFDFVDALKERQREGDVPTMMFATATISRRRN